MRVALALLIAAVGMNPTHADAGAAEAYERLKSVAGDWAAELPGFGRVTSSVRVVSNGRAIEEVIGTPADNELSVYTLDGDRILLTHYCAMTPDGHQVRLQTRHVVSQAERLDFRFVGATNLHSRAAAHMRRMIMAITDRDHYAEKWTKTEAGKDTEFDLSFERR
jgi:hypothetical protein